MLWGIVCRMYRWSKDHFNLNFDITALLTNKHIGISALAGTNQSFHLLSLQFDAKSTTWKMAVLRPWSSLK